MSSLHYKPTTEFKTQKVKGISELVKSGNVKVNPNTLGSLLSRAALVYPYDKDELRNILNTAALYARPCPTTPKHGFLDSRVVYSFSELEKMYSHVLEHDEHGEVLVMPFVTDLDYAGTYTSAILTPYSFVYGRGNAGATTGKDIVFYFKYVCNESSSYFLNSLNLPTTLNKMGIKDVPYIELVYPYSSQFNGQVVQIRDGAKPPLSNNFIPENCTIAGVQVIPKTVKSISNDPFHLATEEEMDLIEWDKLTDSIKEKNEMYKSTDSNSRIVVHMPGKTSTCHYAVHCLSKGIPFICDSKEPEVGTILAPDDDTAIGKWVDISYTVYTSYKIYKDSRLVQSLITHAVRVSPDMPKFNDAYQRKAATFITASLFVAHNVIHMDSRENHVRLFISSVMGYVHIATAIMAGELRHMAKRCKGKPRRITKSPKIPKFWGKFKPTNRDHVQFRYLTKDWDDLRGILGTMITDFNHEGWVGGFGGMRWANCAQSVLDLYNAIEVLVNEPTLENVYSVLNLWHISINMEHNGDSTMMTKLISTMVFSQVQHEPWLVLADREVLNMLLDLAGKGVLHG